LRGSQSSDRDAGLQASDIDGMVTFTMDSSDEIDIARNVGIGT